MEGKYSKATRAVTSYITCDSRGCARGITGFSGPKDADAGFSRTRAPKGHRAKYGMANCWATVLRTRTILASRDIGPRDVTFPAKFRGHTVLVSGSRTVNVLASLEAKVNYRIGQLASRHCDVKFPALCSGETEWVWQVTLRSFPR